VTSHRLLVFSEVFPPRHGGSGRWLWELYRRLGSRPEFHVSVIAGPAPDDARFDAESPVSIERLPFTFSTWGIVHPSGTRAYFRAVARVVRRSTGERIGAVHCGKCLPEGLVAVLAARRTRLPFWCYAHGEELTLAEGSRELTWLTRRVLSNAAGVVANSRHTQRLLQERWRMPADRIVVLHPGVDTARFVPAPADPALRARLGWRGRRVILTVGALQKRKGQDMLIRALPRIRRDVPDVLYAIAGEGWERDYLERLADEQGVGDLVMFHGTPAEEQLAALYQQCDLFALPNRRIGWDFEGFGIVLLEAQACGRPVIAGRSGGTADAMLDGETGLLVDCDAPDALAAACTRLLASPERRAALGARARLWVEETFSWEHLVPQAAALFR
jgi:phosphatidylinositol alpha-1,6-mannosyltransferase